MGTGSWELTEKIRKLESELRGLTQREAVLLKLASAVEHSPISVMITDRAGRIEYVNPKFCEVTGYTSGEVIGKTPRILKGGGHTPEYYRALWETILSGQEWHGELYNRNKDGSFVWELVSISPVRDQSGMITHFVGVKEDIAELKRLQAELGQMAHSDELTGLPNRALFMDRMEQTIIRARRHRSRFALLFVDLDGFKGVNDNYGHQAGDRLLKEVGRRLSATIRQSDTLARIGGDEFTIISDELKHWGQPGRLAMKLLEAFATPFSIGDTTTIVGLSIGISIFPDDAEDAQGLISAADNAMYLAKRGGKNGFRYKKAM